MARCNIGRNSILPKFPSNPSSSYSTNDTIAHNGRIVDAAESAAACCQVQRVSWLRSSFPEERLQQVDEHWKVIEVIQQVLLQHDFTKCMSE